MNENNVWIINIYKNVGKLMFQVWSPGILVIVNIKCM